VDEQKQKELTSQQLTAIALGVQKLVEGMADQSEAMLGLQAQLDQMRKAMQEQQKLVQFLIDEAVKRQE
jgi:hypothetical protein